MGVLMSVVWAAAIWYWDQPPLQFTQRVIPLCLPIIFGLIAIVSLIVHFRAWVKEQGQETASGVRGG